eukprot:737366-Rhodomonas_salina.1
MESLCLGFSFRLPVPVRTRSPGPSDASSCLRLVWISANQFNTDDLIGTVEVTGTQFGEKPRPVPPCQKQHKRKTVPDSAPKLMQNCQKTPVKMRSSLYPGYHSTDFAPSKLCHETLSTIYPGRNSYPRVPG